MNHKPSFLFFNSGDLKNVVWTEMRYDYALDFLRTLRGWDDEMQSLPTRWPIRMHSSSAIALSVFFFTLVARRKPKEEVVVEVVTRQWKISSLPWSFCQGKTGPDSPIL